MLTLCVDGVKGQSSVMDDLYEQAAAEGKEQQVLNAADVDGDNSLHKAATHGLPEVVHWILNKWEEKNVPFDIDAPNKYGYSALLACCCRGYKGIEAVNSRLLTTQEKRREIC